MGKWSDGPVLLLGAAGLLGRELDGALRRRLGDFGAARLASRRHHDLDICDREAVQNVIDDLSPSVVINAAAYTDVDGCETNVDKAMAVNARGPENIAEACAAVRAVMVHFGTDFIFDGRSDRPYRPDDRANPLSVYGRSKWDGEQAVRAAGCHYLIIRTSWLFGSHGRNFVESILAQARSGKPLRVVTDQVGRPTLAADLAEAVIRLLDRGAWGTFHFANGGPCSWFDFACEIIRQVGLDAAVQPITSAKLSRPARRPAYSVLDTTTYTQRTGDVPANWPDALIRCLGTGAPPLRRDRSPDIARD